MSKARRDTEIRRSLGPNDLFLRRLGNGLRHGYAPPSPAPTFARRAASYSAMASSCIFPMGTDWVACEPSNTENAVSMRVTSPSSSNSSSGTFSRHPVGHSWTHTRHPLQYFVRML